MSRNSRTVKVFVCLLFLKELHELQVLIVGFKRCVILSYIVNLACPYLRLKSTGSFRMISTAIQLIGQLKLLFGKGIT